MADVWIAAVVAVLVVGGLVLLIRRTDRQDAAAANELAARLVCPRCGCRPLQWSGALWAEDVEFPDHETSATGFVFVCPTCHAESPFTGDGELHRFDSTGT